MLQHNLSCVEVSLPNCHRDQRDRGYGRSWGRGRGHTVDPTDEGSPNRSRDQRDIEFATMERRIRELERQPAEARMSSTNGEEEESVSFDSSAIGDGDEELARGEF